MKLYYSFAQNGFYRSDFHTNIPADAVEISQAEYETLFNGQANGQRIIKGPDGRPTLTNAPAPQLAAVQAAAITKIDEDAEKLRLTLVTGGSAQAMVYLAKEDEARRFTAATEPVEADYPLLVAEVEITAPTIAGVAAEVLTLAMAWRQAAAQIERVRLTAKKAVSEAADVAAVNAIMEAIVWPAGAA